jgi:hypothetical protein
MHLLGKGISVRAFKPPQEGHAKGSEATELFLMILFFFPLFSPLFFSFRHH